MYQGLHSVLHLLVHGDLDMLSAGLSPQQYTTSHYLCVQILIPNYYNQLITLHLLRKILPLPLPSKSARK